MKVEIRYYSATNTKGTRFRLFRENKAISPFIAMDYVYNTMKDQAMDILKEIYPDHTKGLSVDYSVYGKEYTIVEMV